MIYTSRALSGAFLLACSSGAIAQPLAPVAASAETASLAAPAPSVILGGTSDTALRTGMPILLKTSEALTTKGKKLKVGQRVQMEVSEAVMVNGQVVIPVGSPAMAEITGVRNKGMWGKSGGINAQVIYVRANGRQIRLSGQFDDKGKTGTVGVVAAIALIPIAGFFTTGTSAEIPLGMPVKAFLDEDIAVAFAPNTAPAPMTVPAATAVPVALTTTAAIVQQ